MLLPAIVELRRRVSFRFVVFGLCDRTLDEQLAAIRRERAGFDAAQRERAGRFQALVQQLRAVDAEHHPFVDAARYAELLPALDLDLGLCPLLDTPFNRHKSAVKFYEYAMAGTLTVASDVTPYRDEPALVVDNDPRAWADVLERHARDRAERDRELEAQRAFVLAERSIGGWTPRWAAALRAVRARAQDHAVAH